MYFRYSIYLGTEKKKFRDSLNKIQAFIYSKKFLNTMDHKESMKKEAYETFKESITKIYDDLNTILEFMVNNFVENQLLPKVTTKTKYDPNKAILNSSY